MSPGPHSIRTGQLCEKTLLVGSGNLDHPLRRSWNAFRELIAPFISSPYLAIGLPVSMMLESAVFVEKLNSPAVSLRSQCVGFAFHCFWSEGSWNKEVLPHQFAFFDHLQPILTPQKIGRTGIVRTHRELYAGAFCHLNE